MAPNTFHAFDIIIHSPTLFFAPLAPFFTFSTMFFVPLALLFAPPALLFILLAMLQPCPFHLFTFQLFSSSLGSAWGFTCKLPSSCISTLYSCSFACNSPPPFLPSASFNSRCLGCYWISTTQALNQFYFISTLLVSLFDNHVCWFVVLAFFFGCYLLLLLFVLCFLMFFLFIYSLKKIKKQKKHPMLCTLLVIV